MLCSISYTLADAAGDDKVYNACVPFPGEWDIVGAVWTPSSAGAAAASDTEARTLTVKNGSSTVFAKNTTVATGAAWSAGVPVSFGAPAGAYKRFTGLVDAVIVDSTHTGATGKLANGIVTIAFQKAAND